MIIHAGLITAPLKTRHRDFISLRLTEFVSFPKPEKIENLIPSLIQELKNTHPYGYLSCVFDVTCKKCDGTGLEDELSGGEKIECNVCYGTGVEFSKMENYENACMANQWPKSNIDLLILWGENGSILKMYRGCDIGKIIS